ncbi:MAG: M1 family aminopeptidase [Candidatus Bipolaricaulota bacterium]
MKILNLLSTRTYSIVILALTLLLIFPLYSSARAREIDYQIDASLEEGNHLITGNETIEFSNPLNDGVSEVVLILSANLYRQPNPHLSKINLDSLYPAGFDPGWTKVNKITGPEGNKLTYEMEQLPPAKQTFSLENTIVRVKLANELGPGEKATLNLQFTTKFPRKKAGDEELYKGVYTWRFGWYPMLAPAEWWKGYRERVYGQTKMENANFQVKLNVPEDFTGVGNVTSQSGQTGESKRKTLKMDLSSARSFPLVISSNYRKTVEEFKRYTVEVLHLPGYQEEARLLSSYANEILNFYSERFGEYEREKLTFAQSPKSGYFGMAADGLIVLGGSFFTEKELALSTITNRLSEYLIAHEIAHQWFGIGVGADLNSQNWISEAFAEFLSLRYFHSKYPEYKPNLFRFERKGFIRNAIESQLGYINLKEHTFELPYIVNFQQGFDEAVIKPAQDVKYANATQTRVYKKGYMILRTLEEAIGKEKINKLINKIYEKYGDRIINVEMLASEAREVAGDKVPDHFFQDWLFTDGYLDYGIEKVTTEKLSNGEYLNEIIVTKNGTLTTPVELKATLTSGTTVTKTITLESNRRSILLKKPEKVEKATVDPDGAIMDVNRLNNHYPRKVDISLGENRLPLDAYFVMVGPGTITGRTPNRAILSIGPGLSSQGSLNLNRNLTISGGFRADVDKLSELDITDIHAWFQSSFDFWSNPDTGYASKYWLQNSSLDLHYERFPADGERTYNLFGIRGNLSQSVEENWSLSLGSTFTLGGTAKFSLSASETARILPNIYLNFSANLGLSPSDLPDFLKFDLQELKSYGKWKERRFDAPVWQKHSYPGNYKLFSKISLEFPISTDDKYYLGNLALITQVKQRIFVSGGDTWNSSDDISLEAFKYEGGAELAIQGKTLGGLLPFDLVLGYAYHGQDKGKPYFNISLNL